MCGAGPVGAQTPPDAGPEILARVDAVATQAKDFSARLDLTTIAADGTRKDRTLQLWQRGRDQRMVRFVAPPRLQGVGLLARDDGVIYLYLPAFGKIRRIAGRGRGKSFFGSDFTQDDVSRIRYGDRFNARMTAEESAHWTLRLEPKAPDDEPYHHLVLQVRQRDHLVAAVDCFEAGSDVPVRRIRTSDFRVEKPQPLAYKAEVENTKTGSRSIATLSDVQFDTGLSERFFTQRHLKRGR